MTTMMRCPRFVLAILVGSSSVLSFTPILPYETRAATGKRGSIRPRTVQLSSTSDQAVETLHSLVDYHEGRWKGKATSFTVTADTAAGIVARRTSPDYTVSVKFGLHGKSRDYTLTETIEWIEPGNGAKVSMKRRKLSLSNSNMDVDSVDASYSLDSTLPDFPGSLAGTEKLLHFGIEHCIARSDNERSRCFAFYGSDEQLVRILVCEEQRIPSEESSSKADEKTTGVTLSAQDLIEMQSDVDRLVNKITGGGASAPELDEKFSAEPSPIQEEDNNSWDRLQAAVAESSSTSNMLSRHMINLLELSSGVWLGDAVIRDFPMVPTSPLERGKTNKFSDGGRGFGGGQQQQTSTKTREAIPFASWSIGVQKVAWRWTWNFGEEIRQINDVGKAMGAELTEPLSQSLAGSVCVNEGLSRRIPKEHRMVYIDWSGDNVGFLMGSVSIQVPRYLSFDWSRRMRPFYTEFCCFQAGTPGGRSNMTEDPGSSEEELPEVVCSKISRVYNYEGLLKQGVTSFFTLKRFGSEKEDAE